MVLIDDEVTSEPEVAAKSNGWRDAVAMTASVSVNGVRDAARYSPRWFVLTVILNAIDALIPAAQVWLLAQLVLALDHEGGLKGSVMVPLIGLILVLVISDPVGQIAATSAIRIRFQLMHRYTTDLAHAAAGLRPVQLADPETLTSLESAQKGVGYPGAGGSLRHPSGR